MLTEQAASLRQNKRTSVAQTGAQPFLFSPGGLESMVCLSGLFLCSVSSPAQPQARKTT